MQIHCHWHKLRNCACSWEEVSRHFTGSLTSAQRSRRTPWTLQAAGQGAAATVRRELHYSCRQKTELWGLRICWTLFWGLTWLRGHVSDVCSFVAWSPCTSSSCTFGPSWCPRGVYLPLPASASWRDAHWWPWGGWLCTWDLQWPHETMPLPALWGEKKKTNTQLVHAKGTEETRKKLIK